MIARHGGGEPLTSWLPVSREGGRSQGKRKEDRREMGRGRGEATTLKSQSHEPLALLTRSYLLNFHHHLIIRNSQQINPLITLKLSSCLSKNSPHHKHGFVKD